MKGISFGSWFMGLDLSYDYARLAIVIGSLRLTLMRKDSGYSAKRGLYLHWGKAYSFIVSTLAAIHF